jgi:hypothetical protein
MRLHAIIVAAMVAAPGTSFALDATPAAPAAAATPQSAPAPDAQPNGYRTLAIAAGAVVGVVVVEYLTGGAITPMLGMGPMAAPAAAGAAADPVAAGAAAVVDPMAAGAAPVAAAAQTGFTLAEGVAVAAGAVVGGYVGAWWYGKASGQ